MQAKALGFKDRDANIWELTKGAFRGVHNVDGDFFRQIAQAKRVSMSFVTIRSIAYLCLVIWICCQWSKTRPLFAEPFIPAQGLTVMLGDTPAAKAVSKAE